MISTLQLTSLSYPDLPLGSAQSLPCSSVRRACHLGFCLIGSPVASGPSWASRDWTISVVLPSVGRDEDGVLADTEAEELAGGSFRLALELAAIF